MPLDSLCGLILFVVFGFVKMAMPAGAHEAAIALRQAHSWRSGDMALEAPAIGPIFPAEGNSASAGQSYFTLNEVRRIARVEQHAYHDLAVHFLNTLHESAWPPGVLRRLEDAGLRVSFEAPVLISNLGSYNPVNKVLHYWFPYKAAVHGELAHAISDFLLKDDTESCRIYFTESDEEFDGIWREYITRVKKHIGRNGAASRGQFYTYDIQLHRLGHLLPWVNTRNDPILRSQSYGPGPEHREEFWMEAVIAYFAEPDKLRRVHGQLHDFVARKLALVEQEGFAEAGPNPSLARCEDLPSAPEPSPQNRP